MVTSCDTSFETFVAAVKRLRIVFKDDRFHDFLASTSILAEHHGGEAIGKKILVWSELEVLGVEIVLNKGPLSYVEDDVQMLIPTPNSLIYKSSMIPEEDPDNIIDKKNFRKPAQFIKKCKEAVWSRWRNEYSTCLRERHKYFVEKNNKSKLEMW